MGSSPISLRAFLPSLSVLITNQDSEKTIKKVNKINEINVGLYNLFKVEIILGYFKILLYELIF